MTTGCITSSKIIYFFEKHNMGINIKNRQKYQNYNMIDVLLFLFERIPKQKEEKGR